MEDSVSVRNSFSSPPVPHLVAFVSVPCPKVLRSSPVLCSSKPIFSWSSPAALGNDLNREGISFGRINIPV
jgi:hypothetical protein